MKIKTAELTGAALDWAVWQAQGSTHAHWTHFGSTISPSTDPSQAWPIIERELISLYPNYIRDGSGRYNGWIAVKHRGDVMTGDTTLIAAMRCFVASKLGDEVDVPEELL